MTKEKKTNVRTEEKMPVKDDYSLWYKIKFWFFRHIPVIMTKETYVAHLWGYSNDIDHLTDRMLKTAINPIVSSLKKTKGKTAADTKRIKQVVDALQTMFIENGFYETFIESKDED